MSSTQYTVGAYEIFVIDDHVGDARDPADVFPRVSEKRWARHADYALEPDGTWLAQWRGHLIRRSDGVGDNILVDTGMGPGPYDHGPASGALLTNLSSIKPTQEGYFGGGGDMTPEQVDHVVITHCHGDHIGWNMSESRDGSQVPTFASATYHVARADWDFYTAEDNANDQFDQQVRPLDDAGVLNLVSGEHELTDGITILPTNGHTPGHQCVLIRSNGEVGVLTGDLFHNLAQIVEQDWCPVFDWRTDLSTASRRWLLWRAMAEGWIVFSGHFPTGRSIGRIERGQNDRPQWRPV